MSEKDFIDPNWENTIKEVDPNFEGSIHQQLGLCNILCPTCGAHCKLDDDKSLICLNACHLIPSTKAKYHSMMIALANMDIEAIIRSKGDHHG